VSNIQTHLEVEHDNCQFSLGILSIYDFFIVKLDVNCFYLTKHPNYFHIFHPFFLLLAKITTMKFNLILSCLLITSFSFAGSVFIYRILYLKTSNSLNNSILCF
jgi:hypothetical protein